jgi:hypothetical protein
MSVPLHANPPPKKMLFLLLTLWHHAMAIGLFKVDKLFMFHLPFHVMFRHGSQSKKTKVGGCGITKGQSVLLTM